MHRKIAMPLTSTITPYDPKWPERFQAEARKIAPILGLNMVEIHHVGSTAVVGLAAKPEIDILVVVNELTLADNWTGHFSSMGYGRGSDLSPGQLFFRRDVDGIRTHKIHVCLAWHPQISDMLRFRDLLRFSPGLRERYQTLKLKLEKENTRGIGEYLDGKAPFIRDALQKITSDAA